MLEDNKMIKSGEETPSAGSKTIRNTRQEKSSAVTIEINEEEIRIKSDLEFV